jgi:predicted unusual protein kinase regulating ubiquinone biosynthesis (AarF/ABC1/UbiB family)
LFIKEERPRNGELVTIYKIGILDFGIIGRLSRSDQELLFKAVKLVYQRKYRKIIDIIVGCELSEPINDNTSIIPKKNTERYNTLREELNRVLIAYTTPEIKFFGVSEIYEINYILNNYGLMFKRSMYRLFITVAIMDSIGTRLGTHLSYMQHMTDMVVEIFNIKLDEPDSEDEDDDDDENEDDDEDESESESESES